jgi:hypothetical protein
MAKENDPREKMRAAVNKALNEAHSPDTRTREQKLEQALQGIASCATQCPCCEMHRQVAEKALGYKVEIVTDKISLAPSAGTREFAAGENERCKLTPGCWFIKGHAGNCN